MPTGPARLKTCYMSNARAQAAGFLGAEARRAHAEGQAGLQRHLCQLVAEFGACSNCLGGPPGASILAGLDMPRTSRNPAAMAALANIKASVSAEFQDNGVQTQLSVPVSACDAGAPERSEAAAEAVDLPLHKPRCTNINVKGAMGLN